jgi:serine/threonine protein kinase
MRQRDIKCATILVDANGTVKLADFGLAKVSKLNDIKSRKETLFWMAPEVYFGILPPVLIVVNTMTNISYINSNDGCYTVAYICCCNRCDMGLIASKTPDYVSFIV